jgi:hypothetical protein
VFSVGAAPRLCNEDLRQLIEEMRVSLEMSVEDDGVEKAKCVIVVCEV